MRLSLASTRRARQKQKSSWARAPAAVAERLEQARPLDPVVRRLSDGVVRALPTGPRTDALHGVPFGQPAHPALVRLPLGCWTSAVLLDLFHGPDRASRMLIGAGLAVTVPAAATGLADWSALHADQQRVGLVHALCQAGAATLFLSSLAAGPLAGADRAGGLAGGGLAVATAGSYLDGHLALRLGAGASHADQISHLVGLGCMTCATCATCRTARRSAASWAYRSTAGVPAGRRGERAVRPVLAPGRPATPGTHRHRTGRRLRGLPVDAPPSPSPTAPSCTGPPPPASQPSRPA